MSLLKHIETLRAIADDVPKFAGGIPLTVVQYTTPTTVTAILGMFPWACEGLTVPSADSLDVTSDAADMGANPHPREYVNPNTYRASDGTECHRRRPQTQKTDCKRIANGLRNPAGV
jgi:hypothetical protein